VHGISAECYRQPDGVSSSFDGMHSLEIPAGYDVQPPLLCGGSVPGSNGKIFATHTRKSCSEGNDDDQWHSERNFDKI